MRFPFRDLGVSDAAKLGLAGQPIPAVGERLYELALQLVATHAFTTPGDFGPFTEVDEGANVDVVDGVLKVKGNGSTWDNGVYLTTLKATSTRGSFRIKLTPRTQQTGALGFTAVAAISVGLPYIIKAYTSAASEYIFTNGTFLKSPDAWVVGTQYEFEFAWDPSTTCLYVNRRVVGGAWGVWTHMNVGSEFPANLGLQVLPYHAYATQWELDDYECRYGYATDGPTLTYVADAGENKTFDGWVFANLAAVGSWATTNAKFKYSFDDGTPSYNASWLSLAELNGTAALTTRKRYARLMVQVNSDGATQQYAGEINADDATAGGGDYPEVGNVLVTDTVQAAAGTYAALPAVVDKFNPS